MNKQILAFILSLLYISLAQNCLNPQQQQGQCTGCSGGTQTLVQGYCYQRITGCQSYDIGPICIKCQNGYILDGSICVRQAIFFNRTDLTPAPLVPNIETQLTLEQIRNEMIQKYGPQFLVADVFFTQKNANLGKIEKVDTEKTKKGNIIVIQYSAENKQYIGWAYINFAQQIIDSQLEELNQMPTDPITAIRLVKNFVQLQGLSLYDIKKAYEIDYLNEENMEQVVRITIQKNDIQTITENNLRDQISVSKLQITDLALQEISKVYQYLNSSTAMSINNGNGFYSFFYQEYDSISVQFFNNHFVINRPIYFPPQDIMSQIRVGSWKIYTNYTEQRFVETLNFIRNQIPELENATVQEAYSQLVAGTNFRVLFEPINGQIYDVTVYYNLQRVLQITSTIKHPSTYPQRLQLYQPNYNYNRDQLFFNAYASARQLSQIGNIPSINSVSKESSQDQIYYKVVYNGRQYMQFIVKDSEVHLTGYFIDGQNTLGIFSDYITMINLPVQQDQQNIIQIESTIQEKNPNECVNASQRFSLLTSNSQNLIDQLLYQQVITAIRLYRKDWIFINPVLVLLRQRQIKAYVDDYQNFYEITLQNNTIVNLLQASPLSKSTGNSLFNTQTFPYSSLIIPQGVLSTASLIQLMKKVAKASEKALPDQIINPRVVVASRVSKQTYRLLISTQKSPKTMQQMYYIQYDAIVTSEGYVTYFDAKKVFARNLRIPGCNSFSADGQCLDCSDIQISYGGQCFRKIENCQNQALGICLRCEQNYEKVQNKCVSVC